MGELAIERAVKLEIAVSMVSEGRVARNPHTPTTKGFSKITPAATGSKPSGQTVVSSAFAMVRFAPY
jgi:hypothetical protein|tara:strand:- start:1771 stop:1971 length:201 start_codon:yes stop_codon:yes gene_type:complete